MISPFKKKEDEIQKPEVKPEVKSDFQKTVVLDQENAYLSDIIKAQPKSMDELEVKLSEKADPNSHRLTLPAEIKKYEDKFNFRWIMKHRASIALASQVRKLMFVNKSYFPDLPDHLFSTSGAVERGDAVLVFTLREIAEKTRMEAAKLSRDRVKSMIGAHKNNPDFYTPTDNEDGVTKVVGL